MTAVGTFRAGNEDFCAVSHEEDGTGVVVVADGVSSYEGGEVASRTAVEATLRSYREQPRTVAPAKRLYRAVQEANIAVHDLAVVVPELRGMATTLTSIVVESGQLTTMHVGDCRLYLVRSGKISQLTKDHTVAAQRARLGLVKKERLRDHPDRSVLTRSLGRELIAAVDRITTRIGNGDVLVVCSDGLYNVLEDGEISDTVVDCPPERACETLVERANSRGTPDNLTVAIVRITGMPPPPLEPTGLGGAIRRLLG